MRNDGKGERGPGRKIGQGGKGKRKDVVLFSNGSTDFDASPDADARAGRTARLMCCVDDTDDLTAATSTGYVAELIAKEAVRLGGRIKLGITRHQLLIADNVPYTSHNSAMCFCAFMPPDAVTPLHETAIRILAAECADSADPGLCMAVLPDGLDDTQLQSDIACLEAFGRKAQVEFCTKQEAYDTAAAIPWVQLSEHGGTGQGIVGALAGVGLRLTGEDGRFRGNWNLEELLAAQACGGTIEAANLCRTLSRLIGGTARIVGADGKTLPGDTMITLSSEAKAAFKGDALTFVTRSENGAIYLSRKADLDASGAAASALASCGNFAFDNDIEEQLSSRDPSCGNCLYRRWTATGFECVRN